MGKFSVMFGEIAVAVPATHPRIAHLEAEDVEDREKAGSVT